VRILLIHRHFWPDTPPYAAMLRSIGEKFASNGHEVFILSSQPSYKSGVKLNRQCTTEIIGGMKVRRISLLRERDRHIIFRLVNMVYFPLRIIMFSLFNKKFDIIMASTAPPVVVGFAAALASRIRGAEFFYHCMDIHPEIGQLSGEFRNRIVFNLLRTVDNVSCRIAKNVIVLSKDMARSLLGRPGYRKDNLIVINNFTMPNYSGRSDAESVSLKASGMFRILFAGNIGRFQGLEKFVLALGKLAHRTKIELLFVGEGSALVALKKLSVRADNISFISHLSVNGSRKLMADADLGIVSLNEDIYRYAYPSKTMTYLEEGCPLLVAVEQESELVDFVEKHNVGRWVPPGDPQIIADVIDSIYLDSIGYQKMRVAAKRISSSFFSEPLILEKWLALVNDTRKGFDTSAC